MRSPHFAGTQRRRRSETEPPTACAAPCSSTAREAAALVGADIEAQEVEEAEESDADSVLRANFDGEGSDAA
jgi:hypothetical protein